MNEIRSKQTNNNVVEVEEMSLLDIYEAIIEIFSFCKRNFFLNGSDCLQCLNFMTQI